MPETTPPRRIFHLGLAAAGAVALVVLSAGSASAAPPLDAVDDVATPLTTGGTATASLLATDVGQDGAPADCQDNHTAVKNCDFDPVSVSQDGTNGFLTINSESGDATYTTFLDPADPGYAAMAAGATCTGCSTPSSTRLSATTRTWTSRRFSHPSFRCRRGGQRQPAGQRLRPDQHHAG